MKGLLRKLWNWVSHGITALWPGQQAWRGATWGIIALYATMVVAFALGQGGGGWTLPTLVGLLAFGLVLGGLTAALVDLLWTWLQKLLNTLTQAFPARYRALALGVAFMLVQMLFARKAIGGTVLLVAVVLGIGSLLGAAVWTLARGAWSRLTRLHRIEVIVGGVIGIGLLAGALIWYAWPGPDVAPLPVNTAAGTLPPLALEDPSQPGPYSVRTLTYGSGTDRRRPEYGAEAELTTGTVDGSAFIDRWAGIPGKLRTAYWGFDLTALPLNGRVWYPDGAGPFPLALIVHGNHNMLDYSDPGYAYLGELLASRGIILVSVDENFLNGAWIDWILMGMDRGLSEENDGRGWLLLEHLAQWHRWNESTGNPFYGKVDTDRIAVMGHSRGGEAVAIAAAFNRMGAYPGDPFHEFDYDFGIRSVVAIAPVDGQYKPAERGTPLHDINYLTLQGAYDGDMRAFDGTRQYNRVTFSPGYDGFKAAIYLDRANHGQFNSAWGRADSAGFPNPGLLNLGPIMPEADQQQVAKVAIAAFLEATLKDQAGYAALFRDIRHAQPWLPDVATFTRYDDARTAYLADFEEDVDPTTATFPGGILAAESLSEWKESIADLKWGDQQTSAVTLAWDSPGITTTYALELQDPGALDRLTEHLATGDARVVFSLANGEPGGDPVDLTVEALDRQGNAARLPLSHVGLLPPQPEFLTLKHPWLGRKSSSWSEPVFRVYEFPFADFRATAPDFDPTALAALRFVFDRSEKGSVLLDDIGIRW